MCRLQLCRPVSLVSERTTVVDQLCADRGVGWVAYLHLREDGSTIERCFLRRGKRVWRIHDVAPSLVGRRQQSTSSALATKRFGGLAIWRVRCDLPQLWRHLEFDHMELAIGQVLRVVRSFEVKREQRRFDDEDETIERLGGR